SYLLWLDAFGLCHRCLSHEYFMLPLHREASEAIKTRQLPLCSGAPTHQQRNRVTVPLLLCPCVAGLARASTPLPLTLPATRYIPRFYSQISVGCNGTSHPLLVRVQRAAAVKCV